MLKVFSADWCSACKNVKNFLKANNVAFEEVDIDADPANTEIFDRLHVRSIPITFLDDDNYVIGFNAQKLLELAKK